MIQDRLLSVLSSLVAKSQGSFWHERTLLLLNHILSQERTMMDRLAAHWGKRVNVSFSPALGGVGVQPWQWVITPAGLLEIERIDAVPEKREDDSAGDEEGGDFSLARADLSVVIHRSSDSWLQEVGAVLRGKKPDLQIQGEAAFAADVAWVAANARWDIERDVARVLGDHGAYLAGHLSRQISQTVASWRDASSGKRGL